jgi:hypothetical protein
MPGSRNYEKKTKTKNNFTCLIGTLHQYFDEKWNFMAMKLSERGEKSIGPSQPQTDR